jgi:hypothetical protein
LLVGVGDRHGDVMNGSHRFAPRASAEVRNVDAFPRLVAVDGDAHAVHVVDDVEAGRSFISATVGAGSRMVSVTLCIPRTAAASSIPLAFHGVRVSRSLR